MKVYVVGDAGEPGSYVERVFAYTGGDDPTSPLHQGDVAELSVSFQTNVPNEDRVPFIASFGAPDQGLDDDALADAIAEQIFQFYPIDPEGMVMAGHGSTVGRIVCHPPDGAVVNEAVKRFRQRRRDAAARVLDEILTEENPELPPPLRQQAIAIVARGSRQDLLSSLPQLDEHHIGYLVSNAFTQSRDSDLTRLELAHSTPHYAERLGAVAHVTGRSNARLFQFDPEAFVDKIGLRTGGVFHWRYLADSPEAQRLALEVPTHHGRYRLGGDGAVGSNTPEIAVDVTDMPGDERIATVSAVDRVLRAQWRATDTPAYAEFYGFASDAPTMVEQIRATRGVPALKHPVWLLAAHPDVTAAVAATEELVRGGCPPVGLLIPGRAGVAEAHGVPAYGMPTLRQLREMGPSDIRKALPPALALEMEPEPEEAEFRTSSGRRAPDYRRGPLAPGGRDPWPGTGTGGGRPGPRR